jgi:DNA-binding IclR family transcriptional regulator
MPPTQRLVMLVLVSLGWHTAVGLKQLAAYTGLAPVTVTRCLRLLQAEGWITASGRGKTRTYHIEGERA